MSKSTNGSSHELKGNNNNVKSFEISPKKDLLTVNNKRKREEFKYGNYHNYYYKRLCLGGQQTDLRLEMLAAHPECFRNKSVLDIGCNSGVMTMNFTKQLFPSNVLGIDIDGSLVDKAKRDLQKEKAGTALSDEERQALTHVIFRKVSSISSIMQLELNISRFFYNSSTG